MQVVMYDLPGMNGIRDFASRSQAARVAATWLHVQDCDVYAYLVDCEKQLGQYRSQHVFELAKALGSETGPEGFEKLWHRKPTILLLNKLDRLKDGQRSEVWVCYSQYTELHLPAPASALACTHVHPASRCGHAPSLFVNSAG